MRDYTERNPLTIMYSDPKPISRYDETARILDKIEGVYPFRREVVKTLDYCNQGIDLDYVIISLCNRSAEDWPYPCVGSANGNGIEIAFNNVMDHFYERSRFFVPAFLAHEFAHWARRKLGSAADNNTFSSPASLVVAEGMAEYFQRIKYPGLKLLHSGLTEPVVKYCDEVQEMLRTKMTFNEYGNWLDDKFEIVYPAGHFLVNRYVSKVKPSLKELLGTCVDDFFRVLGINSLY